MFSIENNAGRLIEVRIQTPMVTADIAAFAGRLRSLITASAERIVICTDLRGASVFPPDVADGFVTIMRSDNPKLERSGFLVNESALFSLQVERMIRDAGGSSRRSFREGAPLLTWLGELLSPRERDRLASFLPAAPES